MENETKPTAKCDIGYGKPPVATRWKPGQSGNPGGRRAGAKSLTTMIVEAALAKPKRRYRDDEAAVYPTRIEAAIAWMFESAAHGNEKSRKEALDLWNTHVGEDDLPDAMGSSPDAAETVETAPCKPPEIG